MYRAIVAARTRSVWRRINQQELDVPWRMAAPDLHFSFVGDTPLRPGREYSNVATQWLTLRWGRMTEDWVVEDTVALDRACHIQELAMSKG